jgi:Ni,Fe-hydrogenase III large subunit/Ni,Fe-hydrogenase III component G
MGESLRVFEPADRSPADESMEDIVAALLAVVHSAQVNLSGPVVTMRVPVNDLEPAVEMLVGTQHVRLADMFAAQERGGEAVVLRLVWAFDSAHAYLIVESVVAEETYPALSRIAPAAFYEECEIYEQFGIRPAGGDPLNRVALPPHAGPDFPRLGRPPRLRPRETHAPHTVGGHAFEFPVGPVRQTGVESLYYGLVTSGEEVVDLYLFTWHKHRGVEWRLRGRTPADALFLVERVEGLSAVANAWAFAAAVERACRVVPAPAVARTRAVALELERLYNHAAAIAMLCQTTGLQVGQAAAEIALERLLRLGAATFGHRYLFNVVAIGGARRAPDVDALRTGLPGAYGELRRAADALLGTNSFLDRLEATGILSAEQAARLGLVGPVARSTGTPADVRVDHATPPYDACPPAPVSRTAGDVLARFHVMIDEAAESVRLVDEMLAAGTAAGTVAGADAGDAAGGAASTGLGWAESSRGESLAWVELDGAGRIARARIRPAAARNWRGFDDACRSQNVFTDIPIIEASFWLTVAGTAR